MTSIVQYPIDVLRTSLAEQLQRSADRLVELTMRSRQRGCGGHDPDRLAALIASARQVVSDTAQALRRMGEAATGGRHAGRSRRQPRRSGSCERCAADIALQRVKILRHARFRVPCQRRQTG